MDLSGIQYGWWLLAAPALVPLGNTVVNLLSWPRGNPAGAAPGVPAAQARVSVLIPARNEAVTIEACVRAALHHESQVTEVIVCDDQSSDETAAIVRRLTEQDSRVRLIAGTPLTTGWVGKPHACHQLAQAAKGDVLLFLDADTVLKRGGVARLLSLLGDRRDGRAAVVSAVPRQIMKSFAERLVLPLLMLTYTSWLPLPLIWLSRDERFIAANGQLLVMSRDDYFKLGGFAAVANEIVDDVAICRHAKRQGARVVFADGFHIATCRMYRSFKELWAGFSKNIYEGLGEKPVLLAAVMSVHLAAFVLPYLALGFGALERRNWLPVAVVAVTANLALRALLAVRYRQPVEGIVLHPLAVLVLLALAINSFRWSVSGAVKWAGRTYAGRKKRVGVLS